MATMKDAKVVITYDGAGTLPDMGETFLHCGRCLDEKPDDVSPADWARLSVAVTSDQHAIQVYCQRHRMNVALLTVSVDDGVPTQHGETRH